MRFLCRQLIRAYQRFISPFYPPVCRYYPTCSSYALGSIEQYGLFLGIGRTIRRLLRCHPFASGGYDPVK